MTNQLIALTGFMAAGKTTVGRALAVKCDCGFADLDELIAAQQGRSIAEIIADKGEEYFRRLETAALRELLLNGPAGVIAVGGGTWNQAANRSLLKDHRVQVVWLDAPFTLCWQRIEATGKTRPLAYSREAAEKIYRARRPTYQLADHALVINDETVEEIASRIVELLRQ